MRTTRIVIAAAVMIVAGAAAVPAEAATARPAIAHGGQAGYYVSPGSVNSVHASFVAPTVTCASNSGVQQLRFGVVAPQVNATVTEFAQLDATCTNGVLSYAASLGAGGSTGGGAVSPGDTVTTLVTVTSTATSARLNDLTSGHKYRVDGPGQTLDETVFIGNRPLTGETAVPTFSSPVHFSQLSVNGLAPAAFTHLREYQVHGSKVLISASAISHSAFDVVFVANT